MLAKLCSQSTSRNSQWEQWVQTRAGQVILKRRDTDIWSNKPAHLPTYMDVWNFLPVMLIKSVSQQVTFWELAKADGTKRKNPIKWLITQSLCLPDLPQSCSSHLLLTSTRTEHLLPKSIRLFNIVTLPKPMFLLEKEFPTRCWFSRRNH